MGTVFQIPWTYYPQWPDRSALKALGFKTVAMALREDSISLRDPALKAEERLAIIMGTEGEGLADLTIADSDYTVRIPMAHGVDSLNVASAAAVAFWELAGEPSQSRER
jgi:tRNA G18 (ribose-2'-O)-methylase SpoU